MTDLKMTNLKMHDMKMTDQMEECKTRGAKVELQLAPHAVNMLRILQY